MLLLFIGIGSLSEPAEVVIAIDTSKQMTDNTLLKIVNFIKENLKSYVVSENDVTFSLLSYGENAKRFVTTKKMVDVNKSFKNLPVIGGSKNMKNLLEFVNNKIFKTSKPNVKRLLLLTIFGDVDTNDVSSRTRDDLKRKNVDIAILGINTPLEPLITICPRPNILLIDDIDGLSGLVGPLEKIAGRTLGMTVLTLLQYENHIIRDF